MINSSIFKVCPYLTSSFHPMLATRLYLVYRPSLSNSLHLVKEEQQWEYLIKSMGNKVFHDLNSKILEFFAFIA